MADPVSIIAIGSTVASVAGGVVSAIGSKQAGDSKAAMYNYQAGVAQLNTQIAKQNADYAINAGEVEAQQSGMKTRAIVGTTLAQQGASGLAVGTGANAKVVQSEKEVGEEDVGIIRSNAAKRAYGYEVEATQATAQGGLDTMAASDAKSAGDINAISSLLGTAGSVSSKWIQGNKVGLFNNSNSADTGSSFGIPAMET